MTEQEIRDGMRAEARAAYLAMIREARADYRKALRFADEATLYPENAGTGRPEAIKAWAGYVEYMLTPQWVDR